MKKVETVLFDLDGTLLNTIEDLQGAVNYALSTFGYKERTLEEVRKAVGNGIRKLVERSLPQGEDNPDFLQVFSCFKEYYQGHCMCKTDCYEGIREVLQYLKEQQVAVAIVSNKNQEAVQRLYKQYFSEDVAVAMGVTHGIPKKPHKAMVEKTLEALNKTKEGAIYIGDSEVDEQTGHNAGMPVILVTWGFRTKEELQGVETEYRVDTPGQLLELLKTL